MNSLNQALSKEHKITRPRELAVRFRWVLLVSGIICFAAGVWFLLGAPPFRIAGAFGTPVSLGMWVARSGQATSVIDTIFIVGTMLVTQYMFLFPRGERTMHLADRGRPMWLSILTAALAAALLSIAFAATMLELSGWWSSFDSYFPVFVAMGLLWLGWAAIFYFYWRGVDRQTYLTKTLQWLIGGSVLELLVATPVHAMVRGEHDCYCTRGSYTGLVLSGTVLMWAFGPGIVLLFVREKQRRQPLLKQTGGE